MQTTSSVSKVTVCWQKSASWFLAASWSVGIFFGIAAASASSAILVSLVRRCAGSDATMVGLVAATTLPFLLSGFAVSFSEPWLLLIISMFKAFSFSFCAWGVCLAFGQSSWLVLFLFLFSDLCLIPFQYFYWLRHIRSSKHPSACELPVLLAIALSVGCVDYWFISPFLVSLLK